MDETRTWATVSGTERRGRLVGMPALAVCGLLVGALVTALLWAVPAGASDGGAPSLIMRTHVDVGLPQIDWWVYEGEGVDAINRALRATAAELIEYLAGMGHVFGEYTLRLEQDGLISVSMLYSAYREPMAHPMHQMASVTADVTTGTVYTLADLFVDDRYIDVLSAAVARGIAEQDIPTLIEFERIAPDQDFYLTPDALVVYFQVYDLAPYAWGFPQFEVPYRDLLSIAKPGGPIARLAGARQ